MVTSLMAINKAKRYNAPLKTRLNHSKCINDILWEQNTLNKKLSVKSIKLDFTLKINPRWAEQLTVHLDSLWMVQATKKSFLSVMSAMIDFDNR